MQAGTQMLVFPTNFPDAWSTVSDAGKGEGQASGGEGEAANDVAVETPTVADDSASEELGLQREPAAFGGAFWIMDTQR